MRKRLRRLAYRIKVEAHMRRFKFSSFNIKDKSRRLPILASKNMKKRKSNKQDHENSGNKVLDSEKRYHYLLLNSNTRKRDISN